MEDTSTTKNKTTNSEDAENGKLIEDMSKMLSMGGMTFNRKKKMNDEELMNKERRFWGTQPVPQFKDEVKEEDLGPIDENTDLEKEQKEPFNLPKGYKWYDVDIHSESDLTRVK